MSFLFCSFVRIGFFLCAMALVFQVLLKIKAMTTLCAHSHKQWSSGSRGRGLGLQSKTWASAAGPIRCVSVWQAQCKNKPGSVIGELLLPPVR
jgi:hypothetical protein